MKAVRAGTAGLLVPFAALLLAAASAEAQGFVSAYGGVARTGDSSVQLVQPGGTDLTFREVSWADESFQAPIYYGLRAGYWLRSSPHWGLSADFTHAKAIAELGDTVHKTGRESAAPVDVTEPLGNTFDNLQLSHGHNLLTLNGMYRWLPASGREGLRGRLRPYVGAGVGVAIPHVEVAVGASRTDEYQQAGLAAQGFAGLDWPVGDPLSVFLEAKLSWARIEADLDGGGTLSTEPWTNHFSAGLSYTF